MKRIAFLFAAMTALTQISCISKRLNSHEATDYDYERKISNFSGRVNQVTLPPEQILNFERLRTLIIRGKAKSVEDTLALLARDYPQYMEFYLLLYKSMSLQSSTFENPRAMVFGPHGEFIFTFNGNNLQEGGNAIEIMEYSPRHKRFEFREILFKGPGFRMKDSGIEPGEIETVNKHFVMTKRNPGKCLDCHGEKVNPIWATYFHWPGSYGSNDDYLFRTWDVNGERLQRLRQYLPADRPSSQGRVMKIESGKPDPEVEGIIKFMQAKSTHPRYKWLPELAYESSILRYARGESLRSLDLDKTAAAARLKWKASLSWPLRPNLYFQEQLIYLNQDRVIAALKEKGLENKFASSAWDGLFTKPYEAIDINATYEQVIEILADRSLAIIAALQGSNLPSQNTVKSRLEKNYRREIDMQIEKISFHRQALGVELVDLKERPFEKRMGLAMVPDADKFYAGLMKRDLTQRPWSNVERIALQMSCDNTFLITTVELLLEPYGIQLSDYNMNLRQMTPSFNLSGLDQVMYYLGVIGGRNPNN